MVETSELVPDDQVLEVRRQDFAVSSVEVAEYREDCLHRGVDDHFRRRVEDSGHFRFLLRGDGSVHARAREPEWRADRNLTWGGRQTSGTENPLGFRAD